MKIYELKKMDHFRAEFSSEAEDRIELVVSGVFLGMDGAYAKVQYHGVEYDKEEPFSFLHAATVVKKENTEEESIDGRVVKTRLEKEKAQALYRKIRAAGGVANMYSDDAEYNLRELFLIGDIHLSKVDVTTVSKRSHTIEVKDIKHNSEMLLDAINKVKNEGYILVPF